MKAEITTEAAKAIPPATVAFVAPLNGWTLNDSVLSATLVYIVLQAGYLIWKWWRESRRGA